MICATYLRFRFLVKVQRIRSVIPQKAISPLQPWLSIYGLVWSLVLCIPIQSMVLTIVIFNGFEVFMRHQIDVASWRYKLAPWVTIGVLCLGVIGWLVHGYFVHGEWSFRVPLERSADLHNGLSPIVKPNTPSRYRVVRYLNWILDNIF
jgi:hypothetical protein